MNGTLLDTNILIDVLGPNPAWEQWSSDAMTMALSRGPIFINPIVYAELSAGFSAREDVDHALSDPDIERRDLPWDAAFLAGQAFVTYRARGGALRAPMPDFYIGAHAVIEDLHLLTRDPARYHDYFPTLTVISPPADGI